MQNYCPTFTRSKCTHKNEELVLDMYESFYDEVITSLILRVASIIIPHKSRISA